jgi:hypothetical protein
MLKKPCPWCGVPTAVPPAMPVREVAEKLEYRCGKCRGGVLAQVPWLAFGCFLVVWGGFSNLTVYAGIIGYQNLCAGASAMTCLMLGMLWLAVLLAVSAICMHFLIANCTISKGSRPRR